MTVNEVALGQQLIEIARSATRELVLCAPFAKVGVVERLLAVVQRAPEVLLFTRWRPEEVAAGVSDTAVLGAVEARGGRVLLHDRLHAKYYRNQDQAVLGSANLTGAALGWAPGVNLELLAPAELSVCRGLEELLLAESVVATEAIAEQVDQIAAQLPRAEPALPDLKQEADDLGAWTPALRQPSDLFLAYRDGIERLSAASSQAALRDLRHLEIPTGLDKKQFYGVVASRLLQQPVVRAVDIELAEPRRFGHMTAMLDRLLQVGAEEASQRWQSLMRWLLEFLPHRYGRRVNNWSEIIYRIAEL